MAKIKHPIIKTAGALGALAATAAAAYYFYADKKAALHRRKAKAWAKKAEKEVALEIKKLKALSKPAYEKAVANVLGKYNKLKAAAPAEIAAVVKEFKGRWKAVETQTKRRQPKKRKSAKR